jgi:uncharacterized protein YbaA (DUF1428 family)
MSYIDGFVLAVPASNRQAFIEHAQAADALFLEHGATRVVEAWGDDVPEGTDTDFRKSVHAGPGEVVVFSWVEWPNKAMRDAGMAAFMEDPRLKALPDMPFDGKRMIFGGFEPVVSLGG